MDLGSAQVLAATTDPNDLAALLRHSGGPAAAKAVAQQFGALLMRGLWQKSDGSAIGLAEGTGGSIVNSMFADTMSRTAMQHDQTGLTDLLLRSLEQKQKQQANPGTAGSAAAPAESGAGTAPTAQAGLPLLAYWQANGMRPPGGPVIGGGTILPPTAATAALILPPEATRPPAPEFAPSDDSSGAAGATPEQVADFAARLAPLLRQAARRLGVAPRILLAQAAIETGWGRSIVGNNLFGIKAGASWTGAQVTAATHEDVNGAPVATEASFRAYPSLAASVQDFVALVSGSPRYRAALGNGDDAAAYASALVAGGWATDVNYVGKLEAVAGSRRAAAPFAPVPLMPPDFATAPAGAPVPLVPPDFASVPL